jgi:hypothetical protein
MTPQQILKAQTKEEARQYAIDWQHWASEQSLSYAELLEWQTVFETLADKFDLLEEFKENGVL